MSQSKRKLPFSSKQKKLQLQQRRERKREKDEKEQSYNPWNNTDKEDKDTKAIEIGPGRVNIQKVNVQPINFHKRHNPNRYNLHFLKENRDKKSWKKQAYETISNVSLDELEMDMKDIFPLDLKLEFPKRPSWNYDMSKGELENQEQNYFQEYINNIKMTQDIKNLGYFEVNLETWRQLWRVLEMSEIILIIVDIRFPVLMFPPYLYEYIKHDLKKPVVLVMNKVDLVSAGLVLAWKQYFLNLFPDLHIILFTSHQNKALRNCSQVSKRQLWRRCTEHLVKICQQVVEDAVDLSSWMEKLVSGESSAVSGIMAKSTTLEDKNSYRKCEKFNNGILTIGCIGYPNVGKSSFINALNGEKVVSVSKTPGHTKHFQTIHITSTVRICDCPGLVFPSYTSKPLQVLSGSYPVAQVADPYTVVRFLAERVSLTKILKLQLNQGKVENGSDSDSNLWSAMDISEAWAKKKGYRTAKAARLDTYRAANEIVRMALEGSFCFYLRPPSYTLNKEWFNEHSELTEIKDIQGKADVICNNECNSSDSSGNSSAEYFDAEEETCEMDNKFGVLNVE